MTRRLVYLDSTLDDLVAILRTIASSSGSAVIARRFVSDIERRCVQLGSLPGTLGRARPELMPDIRSIAHRGYIIFFRYDEDAVEIVDVLHGHRDIDSFFNPDEP